MKMFLPGEEKQKFHYGDVVYIKALPKMMSHFQQQIDAIVRTSDKDEDGDYNDGRETSYMLFLIDNQNISGWYPEQFLRLITNKDHLKQIRKRMKVCTH